MFTQLLEPKRPSFIGLQEMELAKLTKSFILEGINFNQEPKQILESLSQKLLKKLKSHQKLFIYNQMNYYDGKPMTLEEYSKEMKKLSKNNLDNLIKKIQETYVKNEETRKQIIKKYNFSNSLAEKINVLVDVLHWQDDRKMFMLSCVYQMNTLLDVLAKRFNHNLEDLKTLLPMEISVETLKLFESSIGVSRRELGVYYLERVNEKLQYEIVVGEEAKKVQIAMHTPEGMKDVHGSSACLGIAVGKAVICLTKDDISKVQEGDVLVASMTRPEFVPAMKKAVAIVTDEGGITCHAAIISRELNKPCIIGTKHATKNLKDGDIVEVNANHGIVRIIK